MQRIIYLLAEAVWKTKQRTCIEFKSKQGHWLGHVTHLKTFTSALPASKTRSSKEIITIKTACQI